MGDVLVLLEKNVVSVARYVHVEQVTDWAFILDVSSCSQVRRKGLVERTRSIVRIQREEIID
eukprot:1063933-Pleurochrysis_carterae.AAC.1